MDICDIGVYDQFCYTGKMCKADKRQCLSTYYSNCMQSVGRKIEKIPIKTLVGILYLIFANFDDSVFIKQIILLQRNSILIFHRLIGIPTNAKSLFVVQSYNFVNRHST